MGSFCATPKTILREYLCEEERLLVSEVVPLRDAVVPDQHLVWEVAHLQAWAEVLRVELWEVGMEGLLLALVEAVRV